MKFNKLIPELSVSNFKESVNFYATVLGFKIEYQRPENNFAFLSLQGAQIMIEEANNKWKSAKLKNPFGRGINFQIDVKKIQPLLDSIKKHNYPIFLKQKDNWYRHEKATQHRRVFILSLEKIVWKHS